MLFELDSKCHVVVAVLVGAVDVASMGVGALHLRFFIRLKNDRMSVFCLRTSVRFLVALLEQWKLDVNPRNQSFWGMG